MAGKGQCPQAEGAHIPAAAFPICLPPFPSPTADPLQFLTADPPCFCPGAASLAAGSSFSHPVSGLPMGTHHWSLRVCNVL